MKWISSKSKEEYELPEDFRTSTCPECSKERKHNSTQKCLKKGRNGNPYCFHCNTFFFKKKDTIEGEERKYFRPTWTNKTDMSDTVLRYWLNRGISQNTFLHFKVYEDARYFVQTQDTRISTVIPNSFRNELYSEKWRSFNDQGKKIFAGTPNPEYIWYNQDALFDDKFETIIICEGEPDLWTIWQVGFKNVISVPTGTNNLGDFFTKSYDQLNKKKQFILATDNDEAGLKLRDELVLRLGRHRCKWLNIKDCTDVNEFYNAYKQDELIKALNNPMDFPEPGLVKFDNFYEKAKDIFNNGYAPGWTVPGLEDIEFKRGRLVIFTGVSSHGKSTMWNWILGNLVVKYNINVGDYAPENHPEDNYIAKWIQLYTGKRPFRNSMTEIEFDDSFDFVAEHHYTLKPEHASFTIEVLLEKIDYLVKAKGIQIFTIDPYNWLEAKLNPGETVTLFVSRFLSLCSNFAQMYNILFCIIAHPRKVTSYENGNYKMPLLMDISDSVHWFNKADYGLIAYRWIDETETERTILYKEKIKEWHMGKKGKQEMQFYQEGQRFYPLAAPQPKHNWIVAGIEEQTDELPGGFTSTALPTSFPNLQFEEAPF